MLPNMKMGLRISRRESGTSISRYSIFGLIFCNFQWSDWEIPEDLFGDNRNQEGSAGTRTTSDTSCLDDRESAGDLHISVWKAGKTQTLYKSVHSGNIPEISPPQTSLADGDLDENLSPPYQIIVADAADAVSVNFSGRCKFLQI